MMSPEFSAHPIHMSTCQRGREFAFLRFGPGVLFTPSDVAKELFCSPGLHKVLAAPIMAARMRVATQPRLMGAHVVGRRVRGRGGAASALMAVTVAAMFVS